MKQRIKKVWAAVERIFARKKPLAILVNGDVIATRDVVVTEAIANERRSYEEIAKDFDVAVKVDGDMKVRGVFYVPKPWLIVRGDIKIEP